MTATLTSTMQATVKRADLIKAIKHVAAAAMKPGMPLLSGALLEAHAEGFLTLRGANLEISVQVPIPADVTSAGALVVPVREFQNLMAFCPGDEVSLSQDDFTLKVHVGDDEFTLCGFYPDKFPPIPNDDDFLPYFVIGRSDLIELAGALTPVVSKDDSKPWLTCIHVTAGDELRAISTNGVSIASWGKPLTIHNSGEALIPPAAFKVAAAMAAPGEEIEVSINPDSRIKITGHDFVVWSVILQGKYPDVWRLVPREYPGSVTMDRLALMTALRAAKVIANDGATKFAFAPNAVHVSSTTPERGTFSRRLSGTVAAGIEAIGFGADLLLEPLKNFRGAEVRFEFSGDRMPAMLTCADQPHLRYVVLPLIKF